MSTADDVPESLLRRARLVGPDHLAAIVDEHARLLGAASAHVLVIDLGHGQAGRRGSRFAPSGERCARRAAGEPLRADGRVCDGLRNTFG